MRRTFRQEGEGEQEEEKTGHEEGPPETFIIHRAETFIQLIRYII